MKNLAVLALLIATTIFFGMQISRKKRAKFNRTKIKSLAEKQAQNESQRLREVNIITQMMPLMSSLNEDAQKNKNYIIFDYDINYPRFFHADTAALFRLIDAIAQIFILNVSNKTIIIKFLLSSYYQNQVRFTLSVEADSNFFTNQNQAMLHVNMSEKSRKFYHLASKLAAQNGSELKFEFKDNSTLIKTQLPLVLSHKKLDISQNLKIKNAKNFTALIAHNNVQAFNILKKDLEIIGIDVKPSMEWSVIKRHIEDTIFRPNIVFVRAKLVKNFTAQMQKQLIDKRISLVVIKNTRETINLDPKIHVQILFQPFLPEMLIRVLNNADEYQRQDGGGGNLDPIFTKL